MKQQIKVIVGSNNPVKIKAAQLTLETLFNDKEISCDGVHAPSNIADQPMTAEDTRLGALNRIAYCQQHHKADFYIAMEGGVDLDETGPYTFAYVIIANDKKVSVGRSAHLPLPIHVYQALESGEELGHVMDRMFNTYNIKQKGGAIGLLTNGHATRENTYRQALILAMSPFLHNEFYTS